MIFLSILSILFGSLLASGTAPTEAELSGEWKYSDSIFVFGEESGKTPSLKDVEDRMTIMGVTADKKHVNYLDKELDCCKGLTLGLEFAK